MGRTRRAGNQDSPDRSAEKPEYPRCLRAPARHQRENSGQRESHRQGRESRQNRRGHAAAALRRRVHLHEPGLIRRLGRRCRQVASRG